jgi:uncharacterized membrane protein YgcG
MIVRIQQFQVIDAERFAAWPPQGETAPIRAPFPPRTNAFELSVLEKDEQGRGVPMEKRRDHLRTLVSPLADALKEAAESATVLRLDGRLSPRELPAAFKYLTDAEGFGRFAFSSAEKLEPGPAPVSGSIRIEAGGPALAAICGDPQLGIDRNVRMRLFCVPAELVNPLLDTADADDERWPDIFAAAHFLIQNTHGLDALHVITRMVADEVSNRISGQLGGGSGSGNRSGSGGGGGGGSGAQDSSSTTSPR